MSEAKICVLRSMMFSRHDKKDECVNEVITRIRGIQFSLR